MQTVIVMDELGMSRFGCIHMSMDILVELLFLPFPPGDAIVWWAACVVILSIEITAPAVGKPPIVTCREI